MAKYIVTHACGHSRQVQIIGPGKDRDRKIAWMQGRDCPDCDRSAKEAEGAKAWAGYLANWGKPHWLISLTDARPLKDDLKARGYYFDPEGGRAGLSALQSILGGYAPPAWCKEFPPTPEGGAEMQADLQSLVAAGLMLDAHITRQTRTQMAVEIEWLKAWTAEQAAQAAAVAQARRAAVAPVKGARVRPRPAPKPYDGDPIKVVDLGRDGATVALPAAVREDFRRRFPRARYNAVTGVWGVPGPLAARRLAVWADRIIGQDTRMDRQRAIDGADFDGVSSPYVTLGEGECIINTPYSPEIVAICKGLGCRWDARHKVWRVDGSMLKAVISAIPEIDRLARAAQPGH